jgi:hypothetical protein
MKDFVGELASRWVEVNDGGACFFHFWYDPEDQSIHDIYIHGDA